MPRDLDLERELLERTGGPAGFIGQVQARVDHSEARGLDGWALGAASNLSETNRHRLVVAMKLGAAAWRELEELREIIASEAAREP